VASTSTSRFELSLLVPIILGAKHELREEPSDLMIETAHGEDHFGGNDGHLPLRDRFGMKRSSTMTGSIHVSARGTAPTSQESFPGHSFHASTLPRFCPWQEEEMVCDPDR
jgi:hypothetical protein